MRITRLTLRDAMFSNESCQFRRHHSLCTTGFIFIIYIADMTKRAYKKYYITYITEYDLNTRKMAIARDFYNWGDQIMGQTLSLNAKSIRRFRSFAEIQRQCVRKYGSAFYPIRIKIQI